jgi:hypothetical protein
MVQLIALLEATQDRHRLRNCRLVDIHLSRGSNTGRQCWC